ncbi:hypothetical protein [Moellerella wisconsensis]|uniref:hypothetical protein n=1 Tax=Moellerella wisconsensis TaxID=158849 RepID=UPI003AABC757
MKNKILLAAVVVLGLVGCKPSDSDIINAVKEQTNRAMKDPTSSIFRDEAIYRNGDDKAYVCGEVNGKNEYGAYTGFKPFIANVVITKDGIVPLVDYADSYSYDSFAPIVCSHGGVEQASEYIKQVKVREENIEETSKKNKSENNQKIIQEDVVEKERRALAKVILDSVVDKDDYKHYLKQNKYIMCLIYTSKPVTPVKIITAFYKEPTEGTKVLLTYPIMPNEQDDTVTYLSTIDINGKINDVGSYYKIRDSDEDIAQLGEKVKKLSVVVDESNF